MPGKRSKPSPGSSVDFDEAVKLRRVEGCDPCGRLGRQMDGQVLEHQVVVIVVIFVCIARSLPKDFPSP